MNYFIYLFILTVVFLLFTTMFIHDYDTVASGIKGSRYNDLIQAEKDYADNGCYVKLSGVCMLIKTKMNNIQDKQPTVIAVLTTWITDGITSMLSQFNVYTAILFIVIIFAFNVQNFINKH